MIASTKRGGTVNVFLYLQGLVGGMRDDEIRRKNLFKMCKLPID